MTTENTQIDTATALSQIQTLEKEVINAVNKKKVNPNSNLSVEKKLAIRDYISDQLDVYRYLFDRVAERFEDVELSVEDKRTIATSLYIGTQRKFNL